MFCDGCNGKGTWFSPMKGDVECDWCHGSGELCGCKGFTKPGIKCWLCDLYVRPDFEAEDTDPHMDGDDGFKTKNWKLDNTPPYGYQMFF